MYCLSLHGASTSKLNCKSLQSLQVSHNNCLRKIWNLPQRTHKYPTLSLWSGQYSQSNYRVSLCHNILKSCLSPSPFISYLFQESCSKSIHLHVTGFNVQFASNFIKTYTDITIGSIVHQLCFISHTQQSNHSVVTSYMYYLFFVLTFLLLHLSWLLSWCVIIITIIIIIIIFAILRTTNDAL